MVSTRRPGDPGAWWSLPGDVNGDTEVSTDEPEAEPGAEAIEAAALWLIDWLAEHGPQSREDVLTAAPHGPAATMAGARLIELDTEADVWCLP